MRMIIMSHRCGGTFAFETTYCYTKNRLFIVYAPMVWVSSHLIVFLHSTVVFPEDTSTVAALLLGHPSNHFRFAHRILSSSAWRFLNRVHHSYPMGAALKSVQVSSKNRSIICACPRRVTKRKLKKNYTYREDIYRR